MAAGMAATRGVDQQDGEDAVERELRAPGGYFLVVKRRAPDVPH